jgi:hypothetical protein
MAATYTQAIKEEAFVSGPCRGYITETGYHYERVL